LASYFFLAFFKVIHPQAVDVLSLLRTDERFHRSMISRISKNHLHHTAFLALLMHMLSATNAVDCTGRPHRDTSSQVSQVKSSASIKPSNKS
jgi:hypothetical protein